MTAIPPGKGASPKGGHSHSIETIAFARQAKKLKKAAKSYEEGPA